jgi:hypothetical protein
VVRRQLSSLPCTSLASPFVGFPREFLCLMDYQPSFNTDHAVINVYALNKKKARQNSKYKESWTNCHEQARFCSKDDCSVVGSDRSVSSLVNVFILEHSPWDPNVDDEILVTKRNDHQNHLHCQHRNCLLVNCLKKRLR